ncbi:MAG: AraC family transcriptional regulator [Spirochaetota bacterium]
MVKIKSSDDDPRIKKALGYIGENYTQDIRVSDIAAYSGVSARRLSELFKERYNCTLKGYLVRARVSAAMPLLHSENMPVNEVARMVGYDDVFYFSRIFRKITGVAPVYSLMADDTRGLQLSIIGQKYSITGQDVISRSC